MRYARGPAPGKVFVIRLQQCIARCNTLLQKSFFQDCKGGGQAGSPITYASIAVRIRSKAPAWAIANTVYVFSRLRIAVGQGTKNGSVTPFPGRLLPLAFKKTAPILPTGRTEARRMEQRCSGGRAALRAPDDSGPQTIGVGHPNRATLLAVFLDFIVGKFIYRAGNSVKIHIKDSPVGTI